MRQLKICSKSDKGNDFFENLRNKQVMQSNLDITLLKHHWSIYRRYAIGVAYLWRIGTMIVLIGDWLVI